MIALARTPILAAPRIIDPHFLMDTLDWFEKRRAGHMSKWLYSSPLYKGDKANGANIWADVVKGSKAGSPYYVYRDEYKAIGAAIGALSQLIRRTTMLADLGPGSFEALAGKVFPLIEASQGLVREYMGIDISAGILDMADTSMMKQFPHIKRKQACKDFFSESVPFSTQADQVIALFYGLTMFNLAIDPTVQGLPDMLLASYFKRLRGHFGDKDGFLVISQDANQDGESLTAAYREASRYYPPLLHRILRDLPITGDFDPKAFEICIDYTPETKMVGMAFITNRSLRFEVGERPVHLLKGEKLYFATAFKPDLLAVQKLAMDAGFSAQETVGNDSHCVLHVLKPA